MTTEISGARAVVNVRLLALAIVRGGRLAMALGGPDRWRREPGCTLIPLELPGGEALPGETAERAAGRIAAHALGVGVALRPSLYVHGPSAARAVDRRPPPAGEEPAPLVLLERMAPNEAPDEGTAASGRGVHPVEARIYRAALAGELMDEARPGGGRGGTLWLPFATLRATLRRVLRGLPLADVLAIEGVEFAPAPDHAPPADALIYLPNEYGERYLMRVVAKYGLRAIAGGGE